MSTSPAAAAIDVDSAGFDREVVERSREIPVVVDFWAAWCGPCRTLGPALESAVGGRDGAVVLAKVDVDRNHDLAARFRVQGIPAVKAFRAGEVVAEFTGAIGPPQIEAFLDQVVPSEADRAVQRARALRGTDDDGAMRELRAALELDPGHREAGVGLAEMLLADDPDAALALVAPHQPDPAAEAVATRAELARSGDGDEQALRARLDEVPGDGHAHLALGRVLAAREAYDDAVEHLLAAVAVGGDVREPARAQLVGLFSVLGVDHPLVAATRPRLARALF